MAALFSPEPRYVLTEKGERTLLQDALLASFNAARSVAAMMPLPRSTDVGDAWESLDCPRCGMDDALLFQDAGGYLVFQRAACGCIFSERRIADLEDEIAERAWDARQGGAA